MGSRASEGRDSLVSESCSASSSTNNAPTRRPLYSSSWFYKNDQNLYPTIEEQVELCRKIASQLVDENNKRSRGAEMFYKRVRRAQKWVHPPIIDNQPTGGMNGGIGGDENIPIDLPKISKEPPKLKLILDPRGGVKTVDHFPRGTLNLDAMSPEICSSIVKDLNSPDGSNKGAQIFARRRQKSDQWVIDENSWRQKAAARDYIASTLPRSKQASNCANGKPVSHLFQPLPATNLSQSQSSGNLPSSLAKPLANIQIEPSGRLSPSSSVFSGMMGSPRSRPYGHDLLSPRAPQGWKKSTESGGPPPLIRPVSPLISNIRPHPEHFEGSNFYILTCKVTPATAGQGDNVSAQSAMPPLVPPPDELPPPLTPLYELPKFKSFNATPKSWQQFKQAQSAFN